ncbi:TraB/GumN family protein [uncultured Sphingomonas sp.]|uniref:TraB/GumN family protein n=1 Tax=uncultured Sphingomonas sp. TaxID=158754 RepID=UPI0035CA6899
MIDSFLRRTRRLSTLAAALLATAPALSAAQTAAPAPVPVPALVPATDADPALWVVRDKDTTIYLFGTIHVLKPGLSWFDEAVKTAFDKSDTLVLEMVPPDQAAMRQLLVARGFTASGPTLTEQLPEKDRAPYAAALGSVGLPAAAFDRARPWVAATNLALLPLMKLGYDPASGPETVLADAARAANKPVEGLETAAIQIGYLADLPQPVQVQFLESTLKDFAKAGPMMATMVGAWAKGDPATLGRIMNDDVDDNPTLKRVLLTDRNVRWAQWIKARLARPGTVFVAVGAGHLAGADSVQDQLRKLKIKAMRVPY